MESRRSKSHSCHSSSSYEYWDHRKLKSLSFFFFIWKRDELTVGHQRIALWTRQEGGREKGAAKGIKAMRNDSGSFLCFVSFSRLYIQYIYIYIDAYLPFPSLDVPSHFLNSRSYSAIMTRRIGNTNYRQQRHYYTQNDGPEVYIRYLSPTKYNILSNHLWNQWSVYPAISPSEDQAVYKLLWTGCNTNCTVLSGSRNFWIFCHFAVKTVEKSLRTTILVTPYFGR